MLAYKGSVRLKPAKIVCKRTGRNAKEKFEMYGGGAKIQVTLDLEKTKLLQSKPLAESIINPPNSVLPITGSHTISCQACCKNGSKATCFKPTGLLKSHAATAPKRNITQVTENTEMAQHS